jgi:general stress protein 26
MINRPHSTVPPTAEERAELWRRLENVRMAMVTTHDAEGQLRSRPITTQQAEASGVLWFFNTLDGEIVQDLGRDPRLSLSYVDLNENLFVALRGTGHVLKDRAKVRSLWNALAGAWFPHGPDNPRLALLRVDVDHGEYWEAGTSRLVQFFSLAKAALTSTPPGDAVIPAKAGIQRRPLFDASAR